MPSIHGSVAPMRMKAMETGVMLQRGVHKRKNPFFKEATWRISNPVFLHSAANTELIRLRTWQVP